ncbi:MAG: 50S ribosomal protein L25 [Minisyncoccia bacterium]
MSELFLKAQKRELKGKKVKRLRAEKFIPGILYGHEIDNIMVQVPYNDFAKIYQEAGGSKIISLVINNGEPHKVLIHNVEIDPLTQDYQHIDFYQIKMTEKITAEVPLHFVGESKAVEEQDGILIKNFDTVEVSCLPADLPSHLEIDISVLENIDDTIAIKDLKLPSGVEILKDPEETIVTVAPPRSEEELAELEEEVSEEEAIEKVEATEEKKEEEEQTEEKPQEEK